MIRILDKLTIDKIAAGEVIERPGSVLKELLENSLDAGAGSISVEIKDGGITMLRITDNGSGIAGEDIKKAFLRHSTSKLSDISDLESIASYGFRGEALSSIASVSRCELITKTKGALTASRYVIEGGEERVFEEVGAPDGTTIIVRDLFFNTPARRKFLKSPASEAAHIGDLLEKIALSNPQCSIRYIVNNQVKLHSPGNGDLAELIYQIYGRSIAMALLPVNYEEEYVRVGGYIAKPELARASRSMEIFFINSRYVRDRMVSKAIEDGFHDRLMQHRFPVCVLNISMDASKLDVNVHPGKLEVRFSDASRVYLAIKHAVEAAFISKELIHDMAEPQKEKEEKTKFGRLPEPFEVNRNRDVLAKISEQAGRYLFKHEEGDAKSDKDRPEVTEDCKAALELSKTDSLIYENAKSGQLHFLSKESKLKHRIVGQIFDTYWIIEFDGGMYIIDQHAAHEKVMYERLMREFREKSISSQYLSPASILVLTEAEAEALNNYGSELNKLGFELEHFGAKEYALRAIPNILPSISKEAWMKELIADMTETVFEADTELIVSKLASLSCKAAVKGNQRLSPDESKRLIDELMSLENPYNCPHGRPTIVAMTKTELEKKFKRIV